jgi:hypothetical protein
MFSKYVVLQQRRCRPATRRPFEIVAQEISRRIVSERASQRAFFGVSALLFAASAAVTIVCRLHKRSSRLSYSPSLAMQNASVCSQDSSSKSLLSFPAVTPRAAASGESFPDFFGGVNIACHRRRIERHYANDCRCVLCKHSAGKNPPSSVLISSTRILGCGSSDYRVGALLISKRTWLK